MVLLSLDLTFALSLYFIGRAFLARSDWEWLLPLFTFSNKFQMFILGLSNTSIFSSSQPVPACSAQATSRPFIDILSIHFWSPSFGPGVGNRFDWLLATAYRCSLAVKSLKLEVSNAGLREKLTLHTDIVYRRVLVDQLHHSSLPSACRLPPLC